jgi:hypothetical protein
MTISRELTALTKEKILEKERHQYGRTGALDDDAVFFTVTST